MTLNTNLKPEHLGKGGEMSFMRKLRVSSWHPTTASNKQTGYLRHNNSNVSTTTRTSGSVVDASDYIRYKKIGAVTERMNK